MLFSLLASGDIRTAVISLLLTVPTIILALSCHEAAHGWMAYKMGDRTAYNLGRVTLNPIKHLDPIGSLMMLIFGYGWAKPVPINVRNFKNPKKGMALTALAGPMANFILGFIGIICMTLIQVLLIKTIPVLEDNSFLFDVINTLYIFFYYWAYLNIGLMVFNLIPLPPFDGSRIFLSFLPAKTYFAIMQYERFILIGILAFSMICSRLFDFSPISWITGNLVDLLRLPFSKLLYAIFF